MVEFLDSFHLARHYQNLVDEVLSLAKSLSEAGDWSLLVSWGEWFIQIPEEQKLCIKRLSDYAQMGLTHVVNVTPSHPVSDWQLSRIKNRHPYLEFFTCNSVIEGIEWLSTRHTSPA